MIKLGLNGARSKMILAVKEALKEIPFCDEFILFHEYSKVSGDLSKLTRESETIIDFSSKEGLKNLLENSGNSSAKFIIGTTGLDPKCLELIKNLSLTNPVLYAANMSVGANLLGYLSGIAENKISDWDIHITETHHKTKRDKPSGTALLIGEMIGSSKEIDYHSLRIGSNPGEHNVIFATQNEEIILSHKIHNRIVFAYGALKAAKWLQNKPRGLYNMFDVLGL